MGGFIVATYEIPEEIRAHNRLLSSIRPFQTNEDSLRVMKEYESIIKIQRLKLEENQEQRLKLQSASNKEVGIVGESYDIRRIRNLCDRFQNSDAPVFIVAETGCGKELVASEIQKRSKRWDKPYIKVNCSAFPETLFESELFGYEPGAFTGALKNGKKGLFEAADSGTIFLDEIGELPLGMQAKLLRVLQEQEITRIGGTQAIPIDVRVIAATNQDIQTLVKEGLFRRDLYFRLNVLVMSITPLRERKDDIEILANHFIKKYSLKYNTPKTLEASAIQALTGYHWPGNVRELENIVERLVAWGTSEHLEREDIEMVTSFENHDPLDWFDKDITPLNEKLAAIEKYEIMQALQLCGTTRKAAAKLGMTQSTLVRRMQEYKMYLEPTSF
jgi:transcriptional regulator with PAS, ATPase and Fis domain